MWDYVYCASSAFPFVYCCYLSFSLFLIFCWSCVHPARGHSPNEFHGLRNDHQPYFFFVFVSLLLSLFFFSLLPSKHSVLPFFTRRLIVHFFFSFSLTWFFFFSPSLLLSELRVYIALTAFVIFYFHFSYFSGLGPSR